MVVIKRSVRATSVPVGRVSVRGLRSSSSEPDSYLLDVDSAAAARRISAAAADDTDALLMASRRHDQQLLDNINAKLASASFNQPVSVKRSAVVTTPHYSSSARPPLPPPITVRRHLLLHHHHADVDDDVEEALIDMPRTPVTASVMRRASSVPPRLPRTGGSGGALSSLVGRGGHVSSTGGHVMVPPHGVPVYEKLVHESRVTNHPSYSLTSSAHLPAVSADAPATTSLTPVADLAVRQAHRNLDRIDKEINLTYAHPDGPHKFSSKTYVAEVPPHLLTVRRGSSGVRVPPSWTYGAGGGGGGSVVVTRRTSSMSPSRPGSVAGSSVQQLHRRHVAASPTPSELLLLRAAASPSPTPLVLPPPSTSAHHHHHHHVPYVAAPSVAELQHQMKVDLLKTSAMDTESPLLLTSVYKHRAEPALPYSAYVSPRTAHVTTNVITTPPLPPAPAPVQLKASTEYAPLPQPISVRPKVSETRRKVRDVLCKIKKDPHYFD